MPLPSKRSRLYLSALIFGFYFPHALRFASTDESHETGGGNQGGFSSAVRLSPSWRKALLCLLPHLFALGLGVFLLTRFEAGPRPALGVLPSWLVIGLAGSLAIDGRLRHHVLPLNRLMRLGLVGLLLLTFGSLLLWFPRALGIGPLLALGYAAVFGTLARGGCLAAMRRTRAPWGESARWASLAVAGIILMHPLTVRALVGAGDALHYARQLADFIVQVRHGVFPVLVGQSVYAFYGDIHPLRTAPYFQHVGGLVDLLTAGTLPAYAVQNLVLVLHLFAAGFTCYWSLLSFAPRRAWFAWLLAVLYVTSPGVLALLYSGDMVASWMTLPWLPLLFLGLIRAVQEPDNARWLALAAMMLAIVWLAHAPIAFWATLMVVPFGVAAVWRRWKGKGPASLWAPAGAGVLFMLLASYVFVSAFLLKIPADPNRRLAVEHGEIFNVLKHGWTGFFRPVSPGAVDLIADLQLSPGLWVAGLLGLAGLLRRERRLAVIMGGILLVFIALLAPIPAVAGKAWPAMPDFVLAITDNWPVLRFYVLLSALVPFLAFLGLAAFQPAGRRVILVMLAAGCVWSGWEARKFVQRGWAITSPPAISARRFLPENMLLSRYSYEYYGHLPRYYSAGASGPYLENRLLDADMLEPDDRLLATLAGRLAGDASRHTFVNTDYGGFFQPRLTLQPGRTYLAYIDFKGARPVGALQLFGLRVLREYMLPASGEERAFGAEPGRPAGFALWITGNQPDSVEVKFIRTPSEKPAKLELKFQLVPLRGVDLPVEVRSVLPYHLAVRSPRGGWVETPKIFLPGYAATVNGAPAEVWPSPDGLVMVAVPGGNSDVVVTYPGAPWLRLGFWVSAATWLAVLLWCAWPVRGICPRPVAGTLLEWIARFGLAAVVIGAGTLGAVSGLAALRAPPPLTHGPLLLELEFPVGRVGTSEPILTAGTGRTAELVFVNYADGKHVRLGYATADGARFVSGPIPVNYLARQRLEISLGAFYPESARNQWVQLDDNAWARLRHSTQLRLNHRLAIDVQDSAGGQGDGGVKLERSLLPLPDIAPEFTGHILANQHLR